MTPWSAVVSVWLAAAAVMTLGWWWQQRHRNAGIVDVIWSFGVAAAAVFYAVRLDGAPLPRLWLAMLAGTWGCRLGLHILQRFAQESEDGRYRQLRQRWHGNAGKFFLMFQFQALLVALFSLAFLGAATNHRGIPTLALALAVAIWSVAVVGESIADHQLARFRADPRHRGLTCRAGLWRYSRHPNYFFEWLHWFSYVALAVGSPLFAWSWLGPLTMYVFLRWLSGVPFTEAQALRTRGDDYREYQRTTPMFFPWFPTRSAPHEHIP